MSEAMCPRVDVEALDKRATLHQLQVCTMFWLLALACCVARFMPMLSQPPALHCTSTPITTHRQQLFTDPPKTQHNTQHNTTGAVPEDPLLAHPGLRWRDRQDHRRGHEQGAFGVVSSCVDVGYVCRWVGGWV